MSFGRSVWLSISSMLMVGGTLALPLHAVNESSFEFPILATLAATVSLVLLLVSCASCRRKSAPVVGTQPPYSNTSLITTSDVSRPNLPPRQASPDYEDLDHALAQRSLGAAAASAGALNPFLNGSTQQHADNPEDLYTKPIKASDRSVSNGGNGAHQNGHGAVSEVTYSDVTSVSRAGTGAAMVPPDRRRTPTPTEAPLKYAVLDFHKDAAAGAAQPPPTMASYSLSASSAAAAAAASPLHSAPAGSGIAKSMSTETRDDVYGNAASILTSTVVPRSAVELGTRIDGGQFGDVFRGILHVNGAEREIAVKAVRVDALESSETHAAFLEETATMAQLQHPNVVQLLAIVEDPLLLIMEFVKEGSVLTYIRAHPALPLPVLLQIAINTAAGLKYLHDHRVIHRDLAARNVLLQGSKGDFIAKVGDLGMARVGDHYKGSAETPLPIRWCALESVYFGTFNRATDVWAFGVFLWELAGSGQFPYSDYVADVELVTAIDKGVRLPQPHGSANDLYTLMCECWLAEGATRPAMTVVLEALAKMQRSLSAFNPNTDMGEYERVDAAHATDLILFARYLCPPVTEYTQVPMAPGPGLYIRIDTFDGAMFRPAKEGAGGQAYEATVSRSRVVFAALLVDELRPAGTLYALRDKGSAHAQLNRRRHQTRVAVETTHTDPDVYTMINKSQGAPGTSRTRVHTKSMSSDDNASPNPRDGRRRMDSVGNSDDARRRLDSQGQDNAGRRRFDSVGNDSDATMARRRVQSTALAMAPQGPPLPARAGSRPMSAIEPTMPRSQSARAGSVGLAGPGDAGRVAVNMSRPSDADQLTAKEWQHVEAWMRLSVSRIQAEQILMAHDLLGAYLVRRSERSAKECALSVRGKGNVQHYKLLMMDDGQVAMVDVTNGNKKFVSLQSLLSSYKLLEPKAIGGLCARLSVCLPPS